MNHNSLLDFQHSEKSFYQFQSPDPSFFIFAIHVTSFDWCVTL
jgi:hypothetical protein